MVEQRSNEALWRENEIQFSNFVLETELAENKEKASRLNFDLS